MQFKFLPQCFLHTFIYGDFPYVLIDSFKDVCCRFVVCGKGFNEVTLLWVHLVHPDLDLLASCFKFISLLHNLIHCISQAECKLKKLFLSREYLIIVAGICTALMEIKKQRSLDVQ